MIRGRGEQHCDLSTGPSPDARLGGRDTQTGKSSLGKLQRKPEEGEACVREDAVIIEMVIIPIPFHQIPLK